jgi:microcystin-dependent protein
MSEPYVGQLLLAGFNFAPKNYAFCNGQIMAINQNQALFSLIGTTFGGNGVQTYGLPNLQGRTPVGVGSGISYGEIAGEESHTLLSSEVPIHTHPLMAGPTATAPKPPNNSTLGGTATNLFVTAGNPAAMNQSTLASYGSGQTHENRQPFLVMNWCIALFGIFPSRN